jgi:hypothetical protein
VVETVSVVVPLVVTEAGLNEQLASFMAAGTLQVKLTVPENDPSAFYVIIEVPDSPAAAMVRRVGRAETRQAPTLSVMGGDVDPE